MNSGARKVSYTARVEDPTVQTADLQVQAVPEDERLWVPMTDNVWFRPLLFDTVFGSWASLVRVRGSGVVSRHLHPGPVHGYVLKGSWRYLEHDWTATEGTYVFEPPGQMHTLVVDSMDEMITFFHVTGSLLYCDENGEPTGYDTPQTRIHRARQHYASVGVDPESINSLIR